MNEPKTYRPKPIDVQAIRWDGTAEGATVIIDWVLAAGGSARYWCEPGQDGQCGPETPHTILLTTPAAATGSPHVSPGEWVCHVGGTFFPCPDEIFANGYDPVETAVAEDIGIADESVPTPPFVCPCCKASLDASLGLTYSRTPKPGDLSVCAYCASFFVFGENQVLREPNKAEWRTINNSQTALYLRKSVRDAIARRSDR